MQVGDVVGNYRITGTLGTGGMGTVYLARHTLIGREAAIKVLQPALCSDETAVARFFNEAKTTTAIRHPGIVEVFDFGYAPDGSAYLVMERLEGESLGDRLRREERLPTDRALSIARQVSGALYAAHKIGIIHRDLKPDNIHIVPDPDVAGGERAKILDFGVAKLRDKDGYAALETQEGAVLGAPMYMAPEQCSGAERVDHRTDLYALGIILFEMLCGRPPFDGMTFGVVLAQQMREMPVAPSSIEPSVPPEVDALVLRLLEKSPDRRFQDSFELLTRFHQLSGLGAPAAPPPGSSTVPSAPQDGSRTPAHPTMSGVVSSARRTLALGPRYRKVLEEHEKTDRGAPDGASGAAEDELTKPLTDAIAAVRMVSARPGGLAAGSQRRPATPEASAADDDSDDGEGYVSDATEDEILSADLLLDPPTSDRIQATRAPMPPAVFARQAMAGAQAPIELGAGPAGGSRNASGDRRPPPRGGPPAPPGSRERDGSGSPVLAMPPGQPPGSSGRPRADGTDDSFFDQLPRADGREPRAGSSPAGFGTPGTGGPPSGPGGMDGPPGFGGGSGRDGAPPFGGPPGGGGPRFDGPPGSGGPRFDGPPGGGGPRFDGPPGGGVPRFDGPPGLGGPFNSGGPRFDDAPGYGGPPGMDGPPGFDGRGVPPTATSGAPTLGMPSLAPPFPPGPPPGVEPSMGGHHPGMPGPGNAGMGEMGRGPMAPLGPGGPPPGFAMPPGFDGPPAFDPMSRPMLQHDPRAGSPRRSGRGGVIAAVVIGVALMGGTAAALVVANQGDDGEVAATPTTGAAPAKAASSAATTPATTAPATTPATASGTTPAAGAADAGPGSTTAVAQADSVGKDAGTAGGTGATATQGATVAAGDRQEAIDRAARTGILKVLKEGAAETAGAAEKDRASAAAAIEGKAASSTSPAEKPPETSGAAAEGASGGSSKDSETNRRPMALITVQLDSLPRGAQVIRKSDGVRLGETPFTYQTEPQKGSIGIVLRHKGYRDETLSLPGNRSSERRVPLTRTDGADRAPSLK